MSLKYFFTGSLTTALLVGVSAWADGAANEYFYQTANGKMDATINASYLNANYKETDAAGNALGNESIQGFHNTGLGLEAGLSDMFSVQATLAYTALTVSPGATNSNVATNNGGATNTINGLNDLGINFKGWLGTTLGRFHFGAFNQISLGPAKVNSSADTTAMDGGFTMTPYLGWDMDAGPGAFGAKLSYDLIKTDRVYHNTPNPDDFVGNDQILTGQQTLNFSLFYELALNASSLGLAVDYLRQSSGQLEQSGSVQTLDAWTGYDFRLYGRWQINDQWAVVPSVDYMINGTKSWNGYYVSSFAATDFAATARYSF